MRIDEESEGWSEVESEKTIKVAVKGKKLKVGWRQEANGYREIRKESRLYG